MHLVSRLEGHVEPAHLLLVYEELDVLPHPVLLVDDANANARVAGVEILEQGGEA